MTDTTTTDDQPNQTEDANTALRQMAQECQRLTAALNEANANAAAWQTRANTLEAVIAAHHDTLEAQRAHLDTMAAAWERDQRRLGHDDRG